MKIRLGMRDIKGEIKFRFLVFAPNLRQSIRDTLPSSFKQ